MMFQSPPCFFFIRSQLNGLVLDIEGVGSNPGSKVITWQQKPEGDAINQLWRTDHMTGTIRSKMNDYCLHISGDTLVVQPYQSGNPDQQWVISGNRIQNRHNPNRVLDIAACNRSPGARVCAWNYTGGQNQHWLAENVSLPGEAQSISSGKAMRVQAKTRKQKKGVAASGRQSAPNYFFIRSHMNGKVLGVEGSNRAPGTRAIMSMKQATQDSQLFYPGTRHRMLMKHGSQDSQLWYQDDSGIIRSKLNDYALDASSGEVRLQPYNPHNPRQQWLLSGDKIVNRNNQNEALDITGYNSADGAPLCAYQVNGGANQQWSLDYM